MGGTLTTHNHMRFELTATEPAAAMPALSPGITSTLKVDVTDEYEHIIVHTGWMCSP